MKIFSKKRNTIWKDKKINDRKFPPILSQSVSFSIPDFFFSNNTLLQTWALEEAHWENLSSQTYYGILRFLADWHNVLKTFLVNSQVRKLFILVSFVLLCFVSVGEHHFCSLFKDLTKVCLPSRKQDSNIVQGVHTKHKLHLWAPVCVK